MTVAGVATWMYDEQGMVADAAAAIWKREKRIFRMPSTAVARVATLRYDDQDIFVDAAQGRLSASS